MANPYREIFRAPGSLAFCAAGLIARMPISMTGIGIITLLAQLRGSYWLAGAVAATFALAMALIAPQISRWVDRYGQRRVLPGVTALGVSSLLALLLCSHLGTPDWTLFVFAALSGFIPSMPAMVRARWTEIYRGQPRLQTAFALESVLDEVCFILGPPLSVGLCVLLFPEAGPLVGAALLAVGVSTFVLQKQTEPAVHAQLEQHGRWLITQPSVLVLMILLMAMGTIVGVVDVVSVAFAQHQGQPAAASIVLSVYAIGSCLAGLAFGALKLNMPLPRQFLLCGLATALTTLPLLWVGDILGLALAVFVSGLFFAPTLIVSMALVEQVVPPSRLTEGMTWLITGLSIGVAIGAASSGWMIDHFGAASGFWVALMAGAVVLVSALLGYRRLG